MARDLERLIQHAAFDFHLIKGPLLYTRDGMRVYRADFNFSGRCEDAELMDIDYWPLMYRCTSENISDSALAEAEHVKIWRELRPGIPGDWDYGSLDPSYFVASSPDQGLSLEVALSQQNDLWKVGISLSLGSAD